MHLSAETQRPQCGTEHARAGIDLRLLVERCNKKMAKSVTIQRYSACDILEG
jgi:hypothetical protein